MCDIFRTNVITGLSKRETAVEGRAGERMIELVGIWGQSEVLWRWKGPRGQGYIWRDAPWRWRRRRQWLGCSLEDSKTRKQTLPWSPHEEPVLWPLWFQSSELSSSKEIMFCITELMVACHSYTGTLVHNLVLSKFQVLIVWNDRL